MAKFNRAPAGATQQNPGVITSSPHPTTHTHEGGAGYVRDRRSELFLLAVTNLVGEDTFYETGASRDDRYASLVRASAVQDPDWTARLLRWLRGSANLRSAAIVGACEYVQARLDAGLHHTVPGAATANRAVIDSVCQRADEPGELLAYWLNHHGRNIPKPVKRGVGDAVIRLVNEYAYTKWTNRAGTLTLADILNICHPGDRAGAGQHLAPWQHDLFYYATQVRYRDDTPVPETLGLLGRRRELLALPLEQRRSVLHHPDMLRQAGITWEQLAGWLQGPMDADAWEAIIPSMGLMALVRNLRNFDQAGVSDVIAATISARLADPVEVARSRQFPFRFLSAFKAAPSLRWAWALEQALQHSLAAVPALPGRTLVLVDQSGSMWDRLSARSTLQRYEAAALFGTALALRAEQADLVQYGTGSMPIPFGRGESVLTLVRDKFQAMGGTNTWGAVRTHYRDHDRVVIVTDEQSHDSYGRHYHPGGFPPEVPIYLWNLAGYRAGTLPTPGAGTNWVFGGLTDAAFTLIPLVEGASGGRWPWDDTPNRAVDVA